MTMKSFTKYKVAAIILFVCIGVFFTRLLICDVAFFTKDYMSPTIKSDSLVIISRFRYIYTSPEYGDIVAIHNDNVNGGYYTLSRVIAAPGQHVEYKNNLLYIDGELVLEDFISKIGSDTANISQVVPPNHYFVVNDNRASKKNDSRYANFGFVSEFDIKGKVVFVLYPFDKIGSPYSQSYDNSFLTNPTPTPVQ